MRSLLVSALTLLVLAPALAGLPARAAELRVLAPQDRSLLRGTVAFRMKPEHGPADRFLANPEVSIQDEYGREVERLRAARDPRTGLCTAELDTTRLPDGLYLVAITYRTLDPNLVPREAREDLTLGIRNHPARPARLEVEVEPREFRTDEAADLTVRVLDARGRPLPAVRVTLRVDRGEASAPAELTDSDGEAFLSVESETPGAVTLTVAVEGLPPVTKTVRFR